MAEPRHFYVLCFFRFSYYFALVEIINIVLVPNCVLFRKMGLWPEDHTLSGTSSIALKQPWRNSIFIIIFSPHTWLFERIASVFMKRFHLLRTIVSAQVTNSSFSFDLVRHTTSIQQPAVCITARYPFPLLATRSLYSASGRSEDWSLLKALRSWKGCKRRRRNCGVRL